MNHPHRLPATLRAPPDFSSADPAVALHTPRRLIGDLLTTWLNRTGFRVVGRVDDIAALTELCGRRRPDLVIVDAGTNISALVRSLTELRTAWHRARIVVIHDDLSPDDLAEAQRSRLGTLIPFSIRLESLFLLLNRRVGAAVTDPPTNPGTHDLTAQERETLNLVSTGHSVQQIAALLNISLSAVEGSKRRIYAKLRVASQSQAVARAVELGLVDALEPYGQPAADRNHPPELTAREFEVLRSIARGDTVRQTARLLAIA
ncbi:MAG TPA: response regulator transcription factor, partial [Actinoplanes sp.]